jgi:hypothetical protein
MDVVEVFTVLGYSYVFLRYYCEPMRVVCFWWLSLQELILLGVSRETFLHLLCIFTKPHLRESVWDRQTFEYYRYGF